MLDEYPSPDESTFAPGPITAGTPVERNFGTAFPDFPVPGRREIEVDMTRSARTAIVTIYTGTTVLKRKVGPGGAQAFRPKGLIYAYTIDVDSGVTVQDEVFVYENGGLVPRAD